MGPHMVHGDVLAWRAVSGSCGNTRHGALTDAMDVTTSGRRERLRGTTPPRWGTTLMHHCSPVNDPSVLMFTYAKDYVHL